MVRSDDFVVELNLLDKDDTPHVGVKNANLGEMIQAGFPVPGGFAVTAHAYFYFLKKNGLDEVFTILKLTYDIEYKKTSDDTYTITRVKCK